VLEELFASFTEDPSMNVRERAGCNLSDCGNFTRKQRMRMTPKFIELAADPGTTPQMRSWCFMVLREITDENLPADAAAWSRWYQERSPKKWLSSSASIGGKSAATNGTVTDGIHTTSRDALTSICLSCFC
jgi:hypothetical protein